MKILVTGGAGFIGSHLCESLLHLGHHVVAFDNLSTGHLKNISSFQDHDHFEFIHGDILEKSQLKIAMEGIELIYHLAAAVGVKYVIDNPLLSIHANVLGTENVFQFAMEKNVKVILASTSEVYGKNDAPFLTEESDRILGNTNITRWSYASSKALDEFVAFAYYNKFQLPIVIARLFNTCGPRQSSRYGMVLPRFIEQAINGNRMTVYGNGKQTRAFTYVFDTVEALLILGFHEKAVGDVFNIGNPKNAISILDLAKKVKQTASSDSEITFLSYQEAYEKGFEDMMHRIPNIDKISEICNFQPKFFLDEMIQTTITSMKDHHALQNI